MIKSIQCVDFQDGVSCVSSLFQSKEGFLKLNYSFLSGNERLNTENIDKIKL